LKGGSMGQPDNSHAVVPKVVFQFLQQTLPFNELDSITLEDLACNCFIDYYPKGTLILKQDVTEIGHFHVIQSGGVKVYVDGADTLVTLQDFCSPGESFGAVSIVKDKKADVNVETVEDTFCILIEKEAFKALMVANPRFARYYLESLSKDIMSTVYTELRHEKVAPKTEERFFFLDDRVGDVLKREPALIETSASVKQAGQRMSQLGVESVLVTDQSSSIVGIVTNKDFRTKVVAEGLDVSSPVSEIMSSPVLTIPALAYCYDALLKMMKEEVRHLAVEHRKSIVGVLTYHDIMVYHGASPLHLFREIARQGEIEDLYNLSHKVPALVRTLVEEGARAAHATQIISIFNQHILTRLLSLMESELDLPSVPFCWLALGSEGRKEQSFTSGQDSAIVFQDVWDEERLSVAGLLFQRFAAQAVEHLEACGFPKEGNRFLASDPQWCKPYSVWEGYFDKWVSASQPENLAQSKVFLDFRSIYGHSGLGGGLRHAITEQTHGQGALVTQLAGLCLRNAPPVSFFGDHVVEKNGKKHKSLDLEARGLDPFVDFARLMALRHGIPETNTLARLQLSAGYGRMSSELFTEIREAYEFNVHLNLVHQLRLIEQGEKPDSLIHPGRLSDLERRTLKEAFSVIDRIIAFVEDEFEPATSINS
ncbi:putative nucleotidyltransferase substrate binding domain-containing protein, partial [Thermodesulfobacteriota bacterium]